MTNAELSRTIKNAFIISIVAGGIIDVLVIIWAIFSGSFAYISFDLVSAAIIFSFCIAPIVMGSIALSMISKCKGYKGSQRVLVILTRIFSISSIVEGATAVTVYGFIVLLLRVLGY